MNQSSSNDVGTIPDLVMDLTFDGQQHDWRQEGTHLICASCIGNSRHGTVIPVGMMLTGSRGDWKIVPEHDQKRQNDIISAKETLGLPDSK